MLRALWILILMALFASACSSDDTADPPPGEDPGDQDDQDPNDPDPDDQVAGLVGDAEWNARVDDYLAFATAEPLAPGVAASPNRVLADVLAAQRDPDHAWDPAAVTVETFASSFTKLDEWKDTGDFDLLYLINLIEAGGDVLDPTVVDAIEQRMLEFRYWYDDPLPEDRLDHKWFWSENHRIIFAAIEYLAGQRLPDETFVVTGLTGAEHQMRARERILAWIDERAEYGFSEWHSNVYMQKNVTPLASLVQWADDEEIAARAAAALDLTLLDVASHLHDGTVGVTHGRSYQKDSYSGRVNDTFGLAKLAFDDTDQPYQSTADAGAVILAMADRYRLPAVLAAIAADDQPSVGRERHGVFLDPSAPLSDDPEHPEGHPFDDVPFWWSQGALTTWQVVPSVFEAAEEYRLWETDLFAPFATVRDLTNDDVDTARTLAQSLAPMASFGLLGEAHTYTWRSDTAMLSSVIDNRDGERRDQARAWQATLSVDAQVFTTHPGNEPRSGEQFQDGDQYWTGTASMPFSAQHENVAIHVYDAAYEAPGPPLDELFGVLDETHAWFPTEHFDEVVQRDAAGGTWTIGRLGDTAIGLWSMRPTQWRAHDPAETATGGLTADFDLVAPGGADNVWIVEIGSADTGFTEGSAFIEALEAAEIDVTEPGDAPDSGYTVRYVSPSVGELVFDTAGDFAIDGASVGRGDHPRLDAPWGTWDGTGPLELDWGGWTLRSDLVTGRRTFS